MFQHGTPWLRGLASEALRRGKNIQWKLENLGFHYRTKTFGFNRKKGDFPGILTMYKSAWWHHVLSTGLDMSEYKCLQDVVFLCYQSVLGRMPRWNNFKNQIRTICLSMGSPHPHGEPLDNISELRLHLSHHNVLYETIQNSTTRLRSNNVLLPISLFATGWRI